MKKYSLAFLLILACFASHAQSSSQPTGLDAERNLKEIGDNSNLTGVVKTFDNRYEGVKGSPYLFDEWTEANVAIKGDKIYTDVRVKYDILEDNLLYKNTKGSVYVINAGSVDYVELKKPVSGKNLIIKSSITLGAAPGITNKFYFPLYEGPNIQLVKMIEKNLIKASYKEAYSAGRTFDEIKTKEVYYFLRSGEPAEKVKLNKKQLLSLFGAQKSAIEAYVKEANVDVNSEEGWIKVLVYYESLAK